MKSKKIISMAVCAIFAASSAGCAGPNKLAGDPDAGSGDCNMVGAAIVGGLLGAAVGGKDKLKGAAIGAGLASLACLAVNARSQQTASAEEARSQYQRDTGNRASA